MGMMPSNIVQGGIARSRGSMLGGLNPVSIGLGAIGLGRSLFGGRRRFKYHEPLPFQYQPDPNDPEYLLRKRRALEQSAADEYSTQNEIGRAGLLGSGASFGILNEQAARKARTLEDIGSDVNMKRRQEQLQLYRDKVGFDRQRALLEDQGMMSEDLQGQQALGDIGSYVGQDVYDRYGRGRYL